MTEKTNLVLNSPTEWTNDTTKVVKYVDLFCGLGAFHTAFDRNNETSSNVKYKCVFACDINEKVRQIYEKNFNMKPDGDINNVNIGSLPEFDLLCAGFPCQPFSIAGKKEGFGNKNCGNLFYAILKFIDIKQPSVVILENVKNLFTIHQGETFKIIQSELENRNYKFSCKVVDSRYYNSPQSRQRVFIICDKHEQYIFKNIRNKIIPVSSIIDHSINEFFDYTENYKKEQCKGKGMMKYKLVNIKNGKGGRQGERVYDIEQCGPTICASSGGPGAKTGFYDFNGKIRTLSIQEALQMFGFDVTYKCDFVKKNDMMSFLGNSVVVSVLVELIKDLRFK